MLKKWQSEWLQTAAHCVHLVAEVSIVYSKIFQTASQESPLPVSGCSTHPLWCMLNSWILFRAPCKARYLAPVLKTEMFAKLDLKGFCSATYLKGGIKTLVTKWHSLQGSGPKWGSSFLNPSTILLLLFCVIFLQKQTFCWNSYVGTGQTHLDETPGWGWHLWHSDRFINKGRIINKCFSSFLGSLSIDDWHLLC